MSNATYSLVSLDAIEVKEQIREIFEDDENTLDDLAASIKARGVLQPILLRLTTNGYVLIAGERRFRAAKIAGLEQIPAYIREMSDEEAEDAQMAENIHRKNLTQIEEAKKIQRDLDHLGNVEAVLEKHNKSRPWLSKMLSLLKLPDQTKRLVVENVSADLEVINTVKIIEKVDPVAAKDLVDNLKSARGKVNAREKASAVKEKVKPSKKQTVKNKTVNKENKTDQVREITEVDDFGVSEESFLEKNEYLFIADGDDNLSQDNPILLSADKLSSIISGNIISNEEKDSIEQWLRPFYLAGSNGSDGKDISRSIIEGLRDGSFSGEGKGAFALVAFLHGTKHDQLDLMKVLDCLRTQHGSV